MTQRGHWHVWRARNVGDWGLLGRQGIECKSGARKRGGKGSLARTRRGSDKREAALRRYVQAAELWRSAGIVEKWRKKKILVLLERMAKRWFEGPDGTSQGSRAPD